MQLTSFSPNFLSSISEVRESDHCIVVTENIRDHQETFSLSDTFCDTFVKKAEKGEFFTLRLDAPKPGINSVHFVYLSKEADISKEFAEFVRDLKKDLVLFSDSEFPFESIFEAFSLASYSFELFKTEKSERRLTVISDWKWLEDAVLRVKSTYIARDLVNLPSNEKYPEKLVSIIRSLDFENTEIRVLDETHMEKESFGMLLAVGKGSANAPRTVIFEQKKGKMPECAFVGKGVTFDAGWVQIKPDDSMHDMKCDMAGAAAVIATMWYLDKKGGYPVVGAIGLVENMLGGNAFKPLDIVRSHNGKTVEIHHTDAEGRLVLGDVVSYVSKEYVPKSLVTIATLTGACMVALGYNYAGLMGTDDAFVDRISSLSNGLYEKTWKLPLDADMRKAVKTENADLKNHSKAYRAGSSMGAAFIAEFVGENIAYAHLDIAAPAYREKPYGVFPAEATGFGFYTLSKLAEDVR